MDVNRLIPHPDPLPAPWGVFNFLLILTFLLHLLITNAMLGTIIITWVNSLRLKRPPGEVDLGRRLAGKLPISIALAINFGVAPLLFLQVIYGQYIYVSSVLMAGYWMSIFVLIILAYYAVYLYCYRYDRLGAARSWVLGLAGLLFLYVGYLFTNSLVLAINPQEWSRYFQGSAGGLLPTGDLSVWPRYLHFVASSVAIGGLVMAGWGRWRSRQGDEAAEDLVRQGLTWYGYTTTINFLIGGLYLATLPNEALALAFFGSKPVAFIFLLGVAAGMASIPAAFSRSLSLTVITSLLSIFFMVLFRFAVRAAYLAPYLDPDKLPVSTQLSPLVLFTAVLIAGVGLVVYILRLAWLTGKESQA